MWNKLLGQYHARTIGPNRPTISEMAIYLKWIKHLKETKKRKLKILVLGSTIEFRDMAYEENLDIYVLENSIKYHKFISKFLKHKEVLTEEHLIIEDWQNLNFENYFDIIIQDEALGNVSPQGLARLLSKINTALTDEGLFLGKNYLTPTQYKKTTLNKICDNLQQKSNYNEASYLGYYLTLHCTDKNGKLNYNLLKNIVNELYDKNIITKKVKDILIEDKLDFDFYLPKQEYYETLLKKHFNIIDTEFSCEVYGKDCPLYIAQKN